MAAQDTNQIKNKIISFISLKGPSLPIHISQEIGMNTLFTSAFLSELQSEKKIKTTTMRVGSSPLYFLQGQERKLENFHEHIKGKEREALTILKENKFLKESELEPPIRVAIKSLKDFAIPFESGNEIFWRYYLIPQEEFLSKVKIEKEIPETKSAENEKNEIPENEELNPKENNIFEKKEEVNKIIKEKKKTKVQKTSNKKTGKKSEGDKFFNKIKELLAEREISIEDIIGIAKNELVLKVKEKDEEKILVAFNKKKITDADILKAHKKASDFEMKYIIFSFGETPKKISSLLEAIKSLSDIRKL